MSDSDVADLKAAKEKLMNSAQAVFAKVYEQQAAAQQGGPQPGPDMGAAGGAQGGGDDNVVDADYKEV
jgi:molecular chaperone DnaK